MYHVERWTTPRGVVGRCFKCGASRMRLCTCFEDVKASQKYSELNDSFAASRQCLGSPLRRGSPALATSTRYPAVEGQNDDARKWQTNWNDNASGGQSSSWKRLNIPRKSSDGPSRSSTPAGSGVNSKENSRPASAMGDMQSTLVRMKEWCDKGLMDPDEYHKETGKVLGRMSGPTGNLKTASPTPKDPLRFSQYRTTYGDQNTHMRIAAHQQRDAHAQPHPHALALPASPLRGAGAGAAQTNSLEAGSELVKKRRIDYLLRQFREICYRKVRGHGSDVSVREIFRHFDSVKDDGAAGIDEAEFTLAVQRMMLGNARDGLITEDEARCLFRRFDEDGSGRIDYREIAANLSAPGWDARFLGQHSNVLL